MDKDIFQLGSPAEVLELIGGEHKLSGYTSVKELIERALTPGGGSLPNNEGLRRKVVSTADYYHTLLQKAGYLKWKN